MDVIRAMPHVGWAALTSSIILIVWGVIHFPWRHNEDRFTHWRDAVFLVALGLIDWLYAAQGHLAFGNVQRVVAGRNLDVSAFEAALRDAPKPPEGVEVWVDTTGTEHQREESIAYARQFERSLREVGWPVTYTENQGPVDLIGVRIHVHEHPKTVLVTEGPNRGQAFLAPEEMPTFHMESELEKAMTDAKVPWQYDFLQPGEPTVRLIIGHQ